MRSRGSRESTEATDVARLEQVVWANLPVGLVLLDEDARVVRTNEVAARILAPTEGPLLGEDFFALGRVAGSGDALERYRYELASGDISFDVPIGISPAATGAKALAQIRSVPLDAGKCRGYAIIEDLSAFRSEQARRVRAERLATAGEASIRLAHEVKNNLQSVALLTELLGQEIRDPRRTELLRLVTEEARRAEGLMKSQLALAREPGQSTLERVDLNALLHRAVKLREAGFSRHGIRVRLDLDRSLPRVAGDSASLLQVVLNLMMNAEEALAGVAAQKRLILRTRKSSAGVVLAVVDNGPGMGSDTLERIFDPFFSDKPTGSGLGLSISSGIVADHRGRLWAESEPSKGTAFFVQLPAATARSETDVVDASDETDDTLRQRRAKVEPKAILLADDEPVIRLAAQQILGARGHTVYAAPNATEALRIAEVFNIDIALVDLHMPGDTGGLVEKLVGMRALRNRVVLISGDPEWMRTYAEGRNDIRFLPKPFSYDELVSLVES